MTKSDQSRSVPVRFSNLKAMSKSPAHYLQAVTQEREDCRAFRIGRGVHAMVLGGSYDHFEGTDRRAKGFAKFERNAKSETVLTNPEYYECLRIATAVKNDHEAMAALSGSCETLIETVIGRRDVRGTPDAFQLTDGVLSDLKTTVCADPKVFSRFALNNHYVNQLAWYRTLIRLKYNVDIRTFRLVAVEKTSPYCVTVINVPLDMIEDADKVNQGWFARLIECEERNDFSGYTGGRVVELVRPGRSNMTALTDELESEAA